METFEISSFAAGSSAAGKWSPEYFVSHHSDIKVAVDHGNASSKQWQDMYLGEYCKQYMLSPETIPHEAQQGGIHSAYLPVLL